MKRFALIGLLLWLTGCAAGDRSSAARMAAPIEHTAASPPAPRRSVELVPTSAAVIPVTIPVVVTKPIKTVIPIEIAPTPTPTARPQSTARPRPTVTSTLPDCPPLPAPTEVRTQAAEQHFEHGLMFWLQDRNEIWTLIESPLTDQFYWRVLPDLWSESQPESDPNLQPPVDRLQPVRGFGAAWRLGGGSYGPQRGDLGWAIDQELGFDTTLIYYPQGYYAPDCTWMPKSGLYELRDARDTVYQFVGAGGIARIVTSN
jgi:hypothetical protein